MIGKVIGAIAGQQAAKHIGGKNEALGAIAGAAAATALSRVKPIRLLALVAGGFALKHYMDRQSNAPSTPAAAKKDNVPPTASTGPAFQSAE